MLKLKGAGKIFSTHNGNTKALENVNLTVARGEFLRWLARQAVARRQFSTLLPVWKRPAAVLYTRKAGK